MGKTKIEWTEVTWNPVTGCTKISAGCKNCYAERMARRFAGKYGYPEQPHHFDVTLHEDRLEQPYHWKNPRMIFLCSMSDIFHEDIPPSYVEKVFEVMRNCPQHTFQVLTKRPLFWDYLFHDLPPNIWMGVTVENQEMADYRIPRLLSMGGMGVRFISVEPMLEPIDLSFTVYKPFQYIDRLTRMPKPTAISRLDWVICGGETGYGAREMRPEWSWDLLEQCRSADVPFFFKQAGDAAKYKDHYPITREYPKVRIDKRYKIDLSNGY